MGSGLPGTSWACFDCRRAVEAQVYGADFWLNLLALSLPLGILAAIGAAAYYWDTMTGRSGNEKQREE